jgi:HK97 family phage major capsid protein
MPDVTLQEAKTALEELKSAFEEHKKVNNQRIEALSKGHSTAEIDEKLARIAADLDKKDKVQSEYVKALEAKVNRITLGSAGGDGESEAKAMMKSFGGFLRKGDEKLSSDERKTLVVSNDTTGGYLAPPQMAAEIIKAEVLYTPVRDIVTVQPVGSAEFLQPKRTGTAAATRQGETGTRVETQNPAWGMMKIPAPEMYAEARVTWANLEDSAYNLESILAQEFGEQFGVKEGAEFISGNGVNQMLGLLDTNAAGPGTPLAYTPSGTAATIAGAAGAQADGLITLFHAVKTAYARLGRWLLNRGSLGKVRMLKDSQGRYLWEPSVAPGVPGTILGAPYTECPDMPDEAANAFPIAFGDFKRGYMVTDRVSVAITRDPYTIANVGQVKFFARKRVGGQVVLGEAIRLYKCAVS